MTPTITQVERAVAKAAEKLFGKVYTLDDFKNAQRGTDAYLCRNAFVWLTRETEFGEIHKLFGGCRFTLLATRRTKPSQPLKISLLLAQAARHMPKSKSKPDHKWTMAEIAELKKSMHLSVVALAERFGVTEAAAREARQRHAGPAVKRWSSEEIQFLRDNAALPNAEIAQMLGRSEGSVLKNRKKHGIPANPPYRWTKKRYHKTTFDITTVSGPYRFAKGTTVRNKKQLSKQAA